MSSNIPRLKRPNQPLMAALREQLQRYESRRPLHDAAPISTGCKAFDDLLPAGGLSRGSLIECLGQSPFASGAGTLAFILARQATLEGGTLVIFDHRRWFYPPAAAALGVNLETALVIRADTPRDRIWALDQCLRCPAVAAVWSPLDQLPQRDFRRLQLACENGGGLGLFVRSHQVCQEPSWADLRLRIDALTGEAEGVHGGRPLRVEILRCRHGQEGGVVELEIDAVTGAIRPANPHHETRTLYSAAQLAYPASGCGSA